MPNQSNRKNQPRTVQGIIRAIEAKSAGGGYIYRGERKDHPKSPQNSTENLVLRRSTLI